jgi:hypothetical protein
VWNVLQEKGITGILNGVEDIVKPDNDELGLEVLYNATSLEKKLEVKATMQEAQVRSPHHLPDLCSSWINYPCLLLHHAVSVPPHV